MGCHRLLRAPPPASCNPAHSASAPPPRAPAPPPRAPAPPPRGPGLRQPVHLAQRHQQQLLNLGLWLPKPRGPSGKRPRPRQSFEYRTAVTRILPCVYFHVTSPERPATHRHLSVGFGVPVLPQEALPRERGSHQGLLWGDGGAQLLTVFFDGC